MSHFLKAALLLFLLLFCLANLRAQREVTSEEYVEFLNSTARSDGDHFYDAKMSEEASGGIVRRGMPGNYYYEAKGGRLKAEGEERNQAGGERLEAGGPEKNTASDPAVFLSYNDVIQYCAWKKHSVDSSFSLQPFAFSLSSSQSDEDLKSNQLHFTLFNDNIIQESSTPGVNAMGFSEEVEGLLATFGVIAGSAAQAANRAEERGAEENFHPAREDQPPSENLSLPAALPAERSNTTKTQLLKNFLKIGKKPVEVNPSAIASTTSHADQTSETKAAPVAELKALVVKHPPFLDPRLIEGGYLFPERGGCFYNDRRYTEHALERMAPETPEIIELLKARVFKRAEAKGLQFNPTLVETWRKQSPEFQEWWRECRPQPRAILPMEVEAEIANPGTTGITVITSEEGDVITAMRTAPQPVYKPLISHLDRSLMANLERMKMNNYLLKTAVTITNNFWKQVAKQKSAKMFKTVLPLFYRPAHAEMFLQQPQAFQHEQNRRNEKIFKAIQNATSLKKKIDAANAEALKKKFEAWKKDIQKTKNKAYQAVLKASQEVRSFEWFDGMDFNKKRSISPAEIAAQEHAAAATRAASDCSLQATKARAANDDFLAAHWLEAARKYQRTAEESKRSVAAYAKGNENEGKKWMIFSWETHASAERAANKARAARAY